MSWLNWSLKLHIRLRTILYLVSTHITHVYVQWMSYSFVWLYLINVLFILNHMLIKHKNIFWVFLVVFGKCFVLKNFRKSNFFFFLQLCFDNSLAGYASCCDSLASESPSCKKNFENFSKFFKTKTLSKNN